MTSFQVEVPQPSPFSCAAVHNRREAFQNNLNDLDITDLWVHQPQWQAGSSSASAPNANNNHNNNNNAQCDPNHSYASDGEAAAAVSDKPKDKWARAREIVFPANTTPPKHSDSVVDVSNAGGVSSLVQKWKGFEAGAKRPPPPPPPPGAASPFIYDDDSIIGDWESDRTVLSGRSSIRGRDSDATESERLRVVDIIRKLTPNEAGSVSPPRSRNSLDQTDLRSPLLPPVPAGPRARTSLDHSELPRGLPTVGFSPRIRGRQAYIDLLVQAERDRRHELQGLVTRKPVSTFSHRGRIQAALKIKLLRRGMETKEAHAHFRQRVDTKAPVRSRSRSKDNNQSSNSVHQNQKETNICPEPPKDHHVINVSDVQDCITESKQQEIHHQDCINVDFSNTYEEFHQAETSFTTQENNWESSSTKSAEAAKSVERNEDEEGRADNYEGNSHHMVEAAAYWVSETSNVQEGWEEFHYEDEQTNETNNTDWIEMVSRPRSDWEYLRQERYQEMLDPFLDKEDIRLLLGRKSVSTFLSSGMRDKIDQLMISRTQGKPKLNIIQRQDKRQEEITEKRRGVVASREGEEEEYFHDYERESSQRYTECDDFTDSTSASWSQNQKQAQNQGGQEPSECSYQAGSPSTQQYMNARSTSFGAHPSLEMDLVYDLRRQIEQLHQEISELRKSIQCSTDMQMKLHRSIKKELNHHPETKSGRRHPARKASGRRCCLCRKVQVDCVLYRCGHMCTCFVCAHQLHWNSGRCPICRDQIVDVIRTQPN